MTKRAVLYARVSGDDTKRDGRGLTGQIEMGRQYAAAHNHVIVAELSEDDRGVSGATFELPQLNRVRDMARAGEFDVLIVRELDRLSRSLAKQLIVEEELRREGVRIEYCLAQYDDTPEGQLNKHVRAVIAEFERLKIRERMDRGRQRKIAEGSVFVSQPAYGYRLATNDGKTTLEIHEAEATIVRLIFDLYVNGDDGEPLSVHAIADKLTALGVPKPRSRRYSQWARSTVTNIIMNEAYIGRWYSGRERVVNGKKSPQPEDTWVCVDVPPIVSQELFTAAQEQRERNAANAHRKRKFEYLTAGRVTCAKCGYSYTGSGVTNIVKGKRYVYPRYRHSRFHYAAGPLDCEREWFKVKDVDTAIWQQVRAFMTDPAALAKGIADYQTERERANQPLRDRLHVVEDLLTDNKAQLSRLLDLYLTGDFPRDILTERKARLQETIVALESERQRLTTQLEAGALTQAQVELVRDFAQHVGAGLEDAENDFKARRKLIELLDVRAMLAVEEGDQVVYFRCILSDEVLRIVPIQTRPSGWRRTRGRR